MNFNSPKYIIRWAIICIITSFFLISCSKKSYQSFVPISSIYDTENKNRNFSSKKVLFDRKDIPADFENLSIRNDQKMINYSKNKNLNSKFDFVDHNFIKYNRNYNNIQKGSYSKNTYIVKRGDTLFYIAWITGNNYYALARRNQIIPPYHLKVGQILIIDNEPIYPGEIIINADLDKKKREKEKKIPTISNDLNISRNFKITISPSVDSNNNDNVFNRIGKWYWPTKGKIVQYFSGVQGGNKGIDIVGSRGQPIFATAAGKVVYVGDALRGYGNLIIIKHNNDYLSAYAHNDNILVDDQYEVKQGEKIATMGSTGTNLVKLHFEIRYKGKSVNPLHYLSKK
ncbi:MAG: peptidoglycan DD-metalloendopeptidase family protein [Arsenophonus sp.]|nr:MAG: peptidoglycan DD-metalloendopeptidase family protein [Arsenophonus sp.]